MDNLQFLPKAVVVKAVVTGQSNETSPAGGQGEEDLIGCVIPHL